MRRLVPFVIVVTAVLFGTYVAGPRAMDYSDIGWFTDDPKTNYLGWLFFRHTDKLTFPLGWSPLIGYPFGEAIAYQDSLPLVSICLWLVRDRLPETFQFLGFYYVLCCVLQMAFGYRISRHFLQNRWAALIASVFFLTAPPFIIRSGGHFALASHWLLLAAIDASLLLRSRFSNARMIYVLVILFITGATNPYLIVMTFGVIGVTLLALPWRIAVPGLALSVVVAMTSLVVFGFIRLDDFGTYKGGFFGSYNADLLTFLDPQNAGALLLKPRQWQSGEAFGYLGLGVLLLILIAFARSGRELCQRAVRFIPFGLCGAAFMILAMSLKASVGGHVIYDIHAPQWVIDGLAVFRSTGRFVWVPYYLIITATIAATAIAFRRPELPLLVFAIVQIVDTHYTYKAIRDYHQNPRRFDNLELSDPVWQSLGKSHRHLVTIPTWQCGDTAAPGGHTGYWTFGLLAANQSMTYNAFHAGRHSPKQLQYFCVDLPALASKGLDVDTAYVFARPEQAPDTQQTHECRMVNGVTLCTRKQT